MEDAVEIPEKVDERLLTDSEMAVKHDLSRNLSQLTIERTRNFNAEKWIEVSDRMVDLMNSFPEWDGTTIDALEEVFKGAYEKVQKTGDEKEVQKFVNRWHGWVAEASVRRVVNELGIGKMKTSKMLDQNGVDGMIFLASPDESYTIFLQIKSGQSVPPGFYFFNADDANYHGEFETKVTNEKRKVRQFISPKAKLMELQEGGVINDFCREESKKIRAQFLSKNKGKVDPNKHESNMLVLLAGVGMQPQDAEPPYGWKELMKMVQVDSDYGKPVVKDVRSQIVGLLSTAEKLEEVA